jgi:adenine C2-methylase RlmN of 23S rRNA A2503 and tRNA A37
VLIRKIEKTRILSKQNPISKSSTKKNLRRLPKAFLDFLADPANDFVTVTSTIDARPTSADRTTTKLAVKLQDGHVVESVLMRHISEGGSRATLCVSSQVGCAMGCTFCATGTMGIRGNLCTGEILEQLVHAGRILAEESTSISTHDDKNDNDNNNGAAEISSEVIISANGKKKKKSDQNLDFLRNVVFMGMGEPLNNYDNVIAACRAMINQRRWNMANNRVTVSTVGVTPKMRQLTKDLPEVNLALSLHAPNQPMREAIVPTAKTYPIQDMVDALDEHMMALLKPKSGDGVFGVDERKTISKKRRAMIEYVMLKGDTSTFECAHQLGKLCENRQIVVNLIPYNQTDVKDKLSCPSEEDMKEFQRIVTSYGSFCTIRRTMGADIAGACGQLVVTKEKEGVVGNVVDIEDGLSSISGNKKILGHHKTRRSDSVSNKVEENSKSDRRNEESSDNDSFEKWIKPLAVATTIAGTVCIVSIGMMLTQRRKR